MPKLTKYEVELVKLAIIFWAILALTVFVGSNLIDNSFATMEPVNDYNRTEKPARTM